MTVKELRVGNIVGSVDAILKVVQIGAATVYVIDENEKEVWRNIRDLHPIPLDYAHFENCFDGWDNEIEADDELKEQLELEEGEVACTLEYFNKECTIGVEIENGVTTVTLYADIVDEVGQLAKQGAYELEYENMSLHQFQNLIFAITGEELKMKKS